MSWAFLDVFSTHLRAKVDIVKVRICPDRLLTS